MSSSGIHPVLSLESRSKAVEAELLAGGRSDDVQNGVAKMTRTDCSPQILPMPGLEIDVESALSKSAIPVLEIPSK